jgi:scyllo-inositol 2-dehydrogenase (NAD+)
MKPIDVGVIGPGWCGGLRAQACAESALVNRVHLAETRPDRLAEVAALTSAATATDDYRDLLDNPDISAIIVSSTPEDTHYTFTKAALLAGKHVLVEKPLCETLEEAGELIELASATGLKLTVGYSQRFNPRMAYARKSLREGTIGAPVMCLVSRHLPATIGSKIAGRTKLSLAVMEASHDIDFLLWCLHPRKPVRVFSQVAGGYMNERFPGHDDHQWILVTMDDGTSLAIGAGCTIPEAYPHYCHTMVELVGTQGMLSVDDSHREVAINSRQAGVMFPMSSMPGEQVDHLWAGPMAAETLFFVDCVLRDRPVLVTAEEARVVMEVHDAADLSVERGLPVSLEAAAAPA